MSFFGRWLFVTFLIFLLKKVDSRSFITSMFWRRKQCYIIIYLCVQHGTTPHISISFQLLSINFFRRFNLGLRITRILPRGIICLFRFPSPDAETALTIAKWKFISSVQSFIVNDSSLNRMLFCEKILGSDEFIGFAGAVCCYTG